MNNYKRLLLYAKPYSGRLMLAFLFTSVAAAGNLFVPWILKDVIDKVLMNKDILLLNTIAVTIVIVFFIRGICFYAQTYLMSYVGQKVIIDIREAVYRKLQFLSLGYFEKRQTGTIMSYVTNDVGALQGSIIESATDFVTEMSILIGSLALMFNLHWKLSLLTLITMPLVAKAMDLFGKKLKRTSGIMQER
ncbi:MAG: ABC transporter ATP-binding protein, partial [Negativicutes bacterium]|nr:ABC transporter ATP-binding protein [Negativicutes bacterium]